MKSAVWPDLDWCGIPIPKPTPASQCEFTSVVISVLHRGQ